MALDAAGTADFSSTESEISSSPPPAAPAAPPDGRHARTAKEARLARVEAEQDFDDPSYADPDDDAGYDGPPQPTSDGGLDRPAKPKPAAKAAAKPKKPVPQKAADGKFIKTAPEARELADPDDVSAEATDDDPPAAAPKPSKAKPAAAKPEKEKPAAANGKPAPAEKPAAKTADPDDADDEPGADDPTDVVGDDDDDADAPSDDGFDDELLAQAAEYGFTDADAREFGTPQALIRAMTAMDRKASQEMRANLQQQQATQQQPPAGQPPTQPTAQPGPRPAAPPEATIAQRQPAAPPPRPAAPAQPPATTQSADGLTAFEKFKLTLDPAEYSEDVISVFNGLNDHYDRLTRELHAKLEEQQAAMSQVIARHQADESRRLDAEVDAFFDGLGDEYGDLFGKGSMHELIKKPNNPQAQHRLSVVQEMVLQEQIDAQYGRKPLGRKAMLQRALRVVHGDHIQSLARKQVARQVQERRQQATSRPSGRNASPLSPEKAAAKRANDFYRSRGMLEEAESAPDEI